MNGTMAPFAAAAIGFAGSSEPTHDANVCACPPLARSRAASAAPGGSAGRAASGSSANTDGASGMTTTAMPTSRRMNTEQRARAHRPIAFTSVADAMPVMMSETISGITVMRMAFTHSTPIGAMASAARSAWPFPLAAMTAPTAMAATSATRTRVPSFIFLFRRGPTPGACRRLRSGCLLGGHCYPSAVASLRPCTSITSSDRRR